MTGLFKVRVYVVLTHYICNSPVDDGGAMLSFIRPSFRSLISWCCGAVFSIKKILCIKYTGLMKKCRNNEISMLSIKCGSLKLLEQ